MTISAPQVGKTLGLALWILSGAFHDAGRVPWPSWWTAPTYDQARHGFTRHVVEYARSAGILADATTQPPLRAVLTSGSVIEARSWDSPEGLYGPTVARIASDEFGYMTSEARAALESRLSESALHGLGYWRLAGNVSEIGGEAESMYRRAASGVDGWAARTWTWRHRSEAAPCACANGRDGLPVGLDAVLLAAHSRTCQRGIYLRGISERRATMSAAHFRQLYEAEWVDWSKLPAYEFDRAVHVTVEVQDEPSLPLDLSCDFNVDPMAWVVGQHRPGRDAWALDEIAVEGGATTRAACEEFIRRYKNQSARTLNLYGDPAGNVRNTKSAKSNETDYTIIEQLLRPVFPRLRKCVAASHPPVTDRLNAFNALLRPGNGGPARYHVHPRCANLANDLARVGLRPGTRDIDKSDKKLTHFSDADGYRIAMEYPIRLAASRPTLPSETELARYRPSSDSVMGMRW
jgi:hypothetical protein